MKFSSFSHKFAGIFLCLIVTASFCTFQILVHRSLPVAHDMVFHVFQADQFIRAIDSGAMFPRWVMSSNGGYGSPNFIFYAPLGYYFVALLHLFVPSISASMILAIWGSFFLSGMSMFAAARRITGEAGSLAAAVIYQILPFHLLDLYMRGTFSELLAFAWFPLILLFLHEIRVSDGRLGASAGLAFSYAGLVLTHLVSGFIFTLVAALYLAWHYALSRDNKFLCRATLYLGVGLGITSYYLVPAVFEQQFVQISYVYDYVFSDFRKNFLFLPKDFLEGFGHFKQTLNIVAILEFMLFLPMAVSVLRERGNLPIRDERAFFVFLFATAFLLTTPLSRPVWELVPGFATLQFPWRWMGMMELSLCFLGGAVYPGETRSLQNNARSKATKYLLGALICISFLTIFSSTRMYPTDFLAGIADPEQARNYKNLPKEYTPIWATNLERMLTFEGEEKVSVLSGSSRLSVQEWQPERRVIGVHASSPTLLKVSTFYYPGWEANIDGRKAQVGVEQGSGATLVEIPPGKHTLILKFADTSLRRLAKYLSIAVFLTFSASLLSKIIRN